MGYVFSRTIAVITFERKLTINKDWRVNVSKIPAPAVAVRPRGNFTGSSIDRAFNFKK